MDENEHKQRHIELHAAMDELLADFLANGPGKLQDRVPSKVGVLQLIEWSYQQTLQPDHEEMRR